MLSKIKEYIESLPDITFDEYFMNYIMKVQDEAIERELHSRCKYYLGSYTGIEAINEMLGDTYRKLVDFNDKLS